MRSSRRLAALLLCAGLASGCVVDQRAAMREAREAYEACVAAHPHDHERECAAERTELEVRSERYETDAQRQWGCNANTSDCDPRDRPPDRR